MVVEFLYYKKIVEARLLHSTMHLFLLLIVQLTNIVVRKTINICIQ